MAKFIIILKNYSIIMPIVIQYW